MKMSSLPALLLSLLMSLAAVAEEAAPAPAAEPAKDPNREKMREIIAHMKNAAKNLKSYTTTVHSRELFGKKMVGPQEIVLKWQAPQRIYLHYIKGPFKGREAIYYQGRNDNEVRGHEGGFLGAINVNLDPHGNLAMKDSHHPACDVSMRNFIRVLASNMEKADKRGEGDVEVTEGVKLWGWEVIKIEATAPKGGTFYTMKDDETLWDVERRFGTPMYHILHHNQDKGWDEADDPDEGDKVFVPRYYASKMVLWIDSEVWMPIKSQIYDHYGRLYEDYEFHDLKVNVDLPPRVFDPDNPEYSY